MSSTASTRRFTDSAFVAGILLIVFTLLAVVAMAHHPTVGRTHDDGQLVQRIAALSRETAVIHGLLIASLLLVLHGLSEFAWRRGFEQPLVRGGAIAYTAGVFVMIGAALVSGFVVTDVASLTRQDTPADLQGVRQLLILCGIVNRACADFGVVAMSVGIGLWSADLLRDRGATRAIGVLGVVVGVAPVVALLAGVIRLDVHGMLAVVVMQAAWNLAIGARLLRAGR